jgi:hypothetical protein
MPVQAQRRSRGSQLPILNPRARRGQMVNFTPRSLYPREKDRATNFTGDCEGPRAGLDGSEVKKSEAFQASAAVRTKYLRCLLASYRRFGRAYRSHPQGQSSKRGTIHRPHHSLYQGWPTSTHRRAR